MLVFQKHCVRTKWIMSVHFRVSLSLWYRLRFPLFIAVFWHKMHDIYEMGNLVNECSK